MSHHRCCCGGTPPAGEWWLHLVSCDCAIVVFTKTRAGDFTCAPTGPPPIGTVLREKTVGNLNPIQPGGCWTVVDILDERPLPIPQFVPETGVDNFEEACRSSCDDEACVDYTGDCPPCPWDLCDGWQTTDAGACGYIRRHAFINRLVAVASAELRLTFQYRFVNLGFYANFPIGTVMTGRDATIVYDATQWTVFDWGGSAPVFVNRTLILTARMQYAEYGPLTGAGCSFDRNITIGQTVTDEAEWFNGPCGLLAPIPQDPIQCGTDPTRLAYGTHGIAEVFGQCPDYANCVAPAAANTMLSREYVGNVLPDDGTCYQQLTSFENHENTIGGNGCGRRLDQVETEDRLFRPWIFTRTTKTWFEESDTYAGCTTGGPRTQEYWKTNFQGAIGGRGWWSCNPSGLIVPATVDPRVAGLTQEANTPRGCCGQ